MSKEATLRPLTEAEKSLVEDHMGLAHSVAQKWIAVKKKYSHYDDLSQVLLCKLIQCAQKFDEHYDGREEQGFVSFAWPFLNGTAHRYFEKLHHMRGLNYGAKAKDGAVSSLDEFIEEYGDLNENPESGAMWERIIARDELLSMFSVLSDIERDSIILTEYMDYTVWEAATIMGKSKIRAQMIKSLALNKIREAYQQNEDGEYVRNPDYVVTPYYARRSWYSAPVPPMLPLHFLGSTNPISMAVAEALLPKKKERRFKRCPVCQGMALSDTTYCLYCDRWGMDHLTVETDNRVSNAAKSSYSKGLETKRAKKVSTKK